MDMIGMEALLLKTESPGVSPPNSVAAFHVQSLHLGRRLEEPNVCGKHSIVGFPHLS